MEKKMNRYLIYQYIDGERDYQDGITSHSPKKDSEHSVGDWLLFMEYSLNLAKSYVYKLNPLMALDYLRKVIALGIACAEYNGIPFRANLPFNFEKGALDIVQYTHHETPVYVNSHWKGLHRDFCLCFSCSNFNPDDREKNCPIANKLFSLCIEHGLTTPVFECPEFKQKE